MALTDPQPSTTIRLPWAPAPVPALWLRDQCPCPECRVTATGEHRVVIGQFPVDLGPVAIQEVDGAVIVDWGDHRSTYDRAWFDDAIAAATRRRPDPAPWDHTHQLRHLPFADLGGPDGVVALADVMAVDGIALIEGAPTTPGTLEELLTTIAPLREVPFGRLHDVLVDPAGYNIAHTAEALPPHNDMASLAHPPTGQLIHMLANDAEGGESIAVDGLAVVDRLDPDDLDVLERVEVGFRQFSDGVETYTAAPIVRRRGGRIVHLRFSNQLMQPIDPFGPDADAFTGAYHRLCTTVLDPDLHLRYRTEAGQISVLAGHRVLHGRAAFDPTSGRRHLQDAYFELDDLFGKADLARGICRS